MLFNSYEFLFGFLPVTLFVFYALAKFRYFKLATASLVLASLAFYSYWDIRYLPLLVISICFNFAVGTLIEKTQSMTTKKCLLALGVTVDIILLGYFKYTNFFIGTINDLFLTKIEIEQIILPLGISFYTFTQIAYLVDSFRGETKKYDFLTYSLFVTFFPHLIAGPILHHKSIIPQFRNLRTFVFNQKNFSLGTTIFIIGLAKKVLIADYLVNFVKPVFDNGVFLTSFDAWLGALAYTFQLYFDFSGYSDMAIGLGLMLNIKLPINFNSPYKSTSIIEFWKRWHITLSEFLKSYLYIPLGGNRHGHFNKMRNLMITMILGGLWHGAGWTYVIWGGLHGLYLVINHSWRKLNIKLPVFISWIITFVSVVIAWVFFRARSVVDAVLIVKTMFGINGVNLPKSVGTAGLNELLLVAALIVIVLVLPNSIDNLKKFKPVWWIAMLNSIIFLICLFNLMKPSDFLYFQF